MIKRKFFLALFTGITKKQKMQDYSNISTDMTGTVGLSTVPKGSAPFAPANASAFPTAPAAPAAPAQQNPIADAAKTAFNSATNVVDTAGNFMRDAAASAAASVGLIPKKTETRTTSTQVSF
jgi:hypothetical protein